MDLNFSFKNKVAILRMNHLRHIPPAQNATEILQEEGVPLVVFEFAPSHVSEMKEHQGICYRSFGSVFTQRLPSVARALTFFFLTLAHLVKAFRREGLPSLLVAHGLQEQILAWVLNKEFGVPYYVHVHEIFDAKDLKRLNRVFLYLEKWALRSAVFTVFPTTEREAIYRTRYQLKAPSYIVFNVPRLKRRIGAENPYTQLSLPKNSVVITYIGGLGEGNSIKEAIQALSLLPKKCVLVLAGWADAAYLETLKKKAESLSVSHRVYFVGPVVNKWEWIKNADVGLCVYSANVLRLQYSAGASNKLFEFISCGVPVITNGAADYRRIVLDSDLGVCAKEVSAEGIAAAMIELLQKKETWSFIGKKAKQLYNERLNYEFQFETVCDGVRNYTDLRKTTTKKAA